MSVKEKIFNNPEKKLFFMTLIFILLLLMEKNSFFNILLIIDGILSFFYLILSVKKIYIYKKNPELKKQVKLEGKTKKENKKLERKLRYKAETYDVSLKNFKELELSMDDYFIPLNYEKIAIFENFTKKSFVYTTKNIEFMEKQIDCYSIVNVDELTEDLVDKIDEEFSAFIAKKYKSFGFMNLTVVFYVKNKNSYFDEYFDNGCIQVPRSCCLYAGVLEEDNKLYICKNRENLGANLYTKRKNTLMEILNIKNII